MQIFVLTNIYSIPEGPIAVKFCLTTFKTNLFQSLVQNLPDMLQICLIGRGIFSFLIGNSFLAVCTSFWCFFKSDAKENEDHICHVHTTWEIQTKIKE